MPDVHGARGWALHNKHGSGIELELWCHAIKQILQQHLTTYLVGVLWLVRAYEEHARNDLYTTEVRVVETLIEQYQLRQKGHIRVGYLTT